MSKNDELQIFWNERNDSISQKTIFMLDVFELSLTYSYPYDSEHRVEFLKSC